MGAVERVSLCCLGDRDAVGVRGHSLWHRLGFAFKSTVNITHLLPVQQPTELALKLAGLFQKVPSKNNFLPVISCHYCLPYCLPSDPLPFPGKVSNLRNRTPDT